MTVMTGREPVLSTQFRSGGLWKLSPRRLATMLNTLPPQAISLPAAAAALHHADFGVRYNAARALSRRADRDARLIMLAAFEKGDARTRASIARHCSGFSWFAALPVLNAALADADLRVREAAVYALCDYTEPQAYETLAAALRDEHDDVRLAAAVGLRDRQDPAAVPVLTLVLAAEDPDVRVAALEALGANHTPAAVPVVQRAMEHDPDPDVVYNAALSLAELQEMKALPALIRGIQTRTGAMRGAISRGWFHASGYMQLDLLADPHLADLLDGLMLALNDTAARFDVIWPLAWLRHPRTQTALHEAYIAADDVAFKLHIIRVAWGLMADCRHELLADALADSQLRTEVEPLAARQRDYLAYDATASAGVGLRNPVLGV